MEEDKTHCTVIDMEQFQLDFVYIHKMIVQIGGIYMKKSAAIAIVLMLLLSLAACGEKTENGGSAADRAESPRANRDIVETELSQSENTKPVSGIVSHAGTDKLVELTAEETKQMIEIIENGTWNTAGTADCFNDCTLTIGGETYSYHSECGTWNDNLNDRCLTVTDAEKEIINAVLSQYITLNSPTGTETLTPLSFSYQEDTATYKAGDPGVKSYDFVNVSTQPIDRQDTALKLAKHECTVEYDTTNVYYDGETAMWKVLFSTTGTAGGDQAVYLDSSGITRLVVYGE